MSSDIKEIKDDLREIKVDLREHMCRTAASEARISFMENHFLGENSPLKALSKQNEKHLNAMNKQLKISLGIVAFFAAIFTALAAFIGGK